MRSDFGRTLRSIRTDQTAALALGIDVPRYKLYAFLIGAAFASIAGSLLAFDFQFLSPDMVSTSQSFLIVTMLVIGGEATLVGPVIGVVLLTLLPTAFQFLANYKTLASGDLAVSSRCSTSRAASTAASPRSTAHLGRPPADAHARLPVEHVTA